MIGLCETVMQYPPTASSTNLPNALRGLPDAAFGRIRYRMSQRSGGVEVNDSTAAQQGYGNRLYAKVLSQVNIPHLLVLHDLVNVSFSDNVTFTEDHRIVADIQSFAYVVIGNENADIFFA